MSHRELVVGKSISKTVLLKTDDRLPTCSWFLANDRRLTTNDGFLQVRFSCQISLC